MQLNTVSAQREFDNAKMHEEFSHAQNANTSNTYTHKAGAKNAQNAGRCTAKSEIVLAFALVVAPVLVLVRCLS